MIPEFPQFKKLELSDKEDVEGFTSKFPPYSDFNFVSMWSWDTKEGMRLSVLNNNLVVRFTDYLTGDFFYSFFGDNEVNDTVEKLLEISKNEKLEPLLKLIPEIATRNLDLKKYFLKADPNNFDYISDIDSVSEYRGPRFAGKRKKSNSFFRNFPNIRRVILDLKNITTEKDVLELDEEWLEDKIEKNRDYEFNNNEAVAIDRFFNLKTTNMLGIGLFDEKRLIGYSLFQILPDGYSICHFSKADAHYDSIYEYLEKESNIVLKSLGCSLLNNEQDLGIRGLRESKMSFLLMYLRKFTVGFIDNK